MQSASLCTLYKQRGAREVCGSYRAIMLLSTIAKAIHRSLRPKLYAHVDQCAPPLFLGGVKAPPLFLGGILCGAFVDGSCMLSPRLPLSLRMSHRHITVPSENSQHGSPPAEIRVLSLILCSQTMMVYCFVSAPKASYALGAPVHGLKL